jgi:2-polyprenyl-3-methyl-5-hydroxy-6-metoxy-1,4-benzoquinol methylase
MFSSEEKALARQRGQAEKPPVADDDRWNHNIQYHPVLLDLVPPGAARALDVGCGDGMLSRRLAPLVDQVTGIDLDQPSIDVARRETAATNVEYVVGDILTYPFDPESFDVVVCVMALHHLDTTEGLERLASLVRPPGVLGVIGAGRMQLPHDIPYELAGAVGTRLHKLTKTLWEQPSPMVWPPPDTFRQTKRTSAALLPGSDYRHRALWRYTLTWTKPD